MTQSPIEMLEAEHHFIAKVVSAAGLLADKLEAGQSIEAQVFQNVVEFMRLYADKCHHGKEEDLLFPLLAERGVPLRGCPVDALPREHAMGRALVKGLAEAAAALQTDDPSAREISSRICAASPICIPITSGKKTTCCSRCRTKCSARKISRNWRWNSIGWKRLSGALCMSSLSA